MVQRLILISVFISTIRIMQALQVKLEIGYLSFLKHFLLKLKPWLERSKSNLGKAGN